jgi:hypothetical protein
LSEIIVQQMKKHILPGLLLAATIITATAFTTNAQIKNDKGTFTLPSRGDILVETQGYFNVNGGTLFTFADGYLANMNNGYDTAFHLIGGSSNYPMIKLRFFGQNNLVHRVTFNFSYSSDRRTISSDIAKNTNFGIALGYGCEKMFSPAERLNTYVGGDITIGYGRVTTSSGNNDASQNCWGFGLRGFTGADYYVLPKVYVGMELGWGVNYMRYGNVSYSSGNNETTTESFNAVPYITPTFRLGYMLVWTKKSKSNSEPSYRSKDKDSDE